MGSSGVRLIFLNITLRLYVLRLLLICSLAVFTINVEWIRALYRPPTKWILLFVLIFVHHLLSVKRWRFFYGLPDFLLLGLEIVGTRMYTAHVPITSWFPESLILHAVLCWTVFLTLIFLATFRLATLVNTKGAYLWTAFDMFSDQPAFKTRPRAFNMLLGRSIWRENFVGETKAVRSIRGVLGLIFLAGVLFFSLLNVIFKPMQETALSPVKEFRTSTTPADLLDDIDFPAWNIVFPVPLLVDENDQESQLPAISQDVFFSAVNVTTLWDSTVNESERSNCTKGSSPINDGTIAYVFTCRVAHIGDSLRLPELVIVADFSFFDGSVDETTLSLPLILGLTDDIRQVARRVVPIPLVPGVNIMSSYILEIRQVFVHPALAALGMFQSSQSFWSAKALHVYPDPSISPLIPRGANISTLRVWQQPDYSEKTVIQDYRENSVMSGFSAVGGLWTALSGIFTIIFGASMLHILYGSKPLSIFGMAHSFQSDQMKEECLRLYPNILTEHHNETERGLLALLRDHLIDLNFLEEKQSKKDLDENEKNDVENPITTIAYNGGTDDSPVGRPGHVRALSSDFGAEEKLTPVRRSSGA